jgi:1-acyl-sn-glycerol-3-phosphate acyltransferase
MIGALRVAFVFSIFALFTLPLLPLQYVSMKFERFVHKSLPRFWHRVIARLLGIRVQVIGGLSAERPLLIVSNHSSWADIVILSAIAEVSFIAKSEVKSWPLFGLFAVLQRSVFVERHRKQSAGDQADTIAARLAQGDAMVLFAEGTTSDGNRVLPFKSALFGAAQVALRGTEAHKVLIQPVSIAYTRVHGLPMGRYMRPVSSWPGTVPLSANLIAMAREGALDVEVRIGAPVEFTPNSSRKSVAAEMERQVRAMMQTSLMGREIEPVVFNGAETV